MIENASSPRPFRSAAGSRGCSPPARPPRSTYARRRTPVQCSPRPRLPPGAKRRSACRVPRLLRYPIEIASVPRCSCRRRAGKGSRAAPPPRTRSRNRGTDRTRTGRTTDHRAVRRRSETSSPSNRASSASFPQYRASATAAPPSRKSDVAGNSDRADRSSRFRKADSPADRRAIPPWS